MTFTQRRAGAAVPIRLRGHNGAQQTRPRTRTPGPPPVNPAGDTVYAAEPLGAGGWVTGLSISPDGNTRLVRTDTLGAWRWSAGADQWVTATSAATMPADGSAALDSGIGVQAVVAANTVAYLGYKSSIYKSVDGGQHWTVSLANGPTTAPNVGDQRWWQTRMAVDPASDAVCLYGTVAGGLYWTTDTGTTWTQVPSSSVPLGLSGTGIAAVTIDTAGNWYAAPFGSGLYRSTNRGGSWAKTSSDSDFTAVTNMAAGPNGDIMVSAHTSATSIVVATSRVFRYRAGAWSNLTPTGTNNDRKWRSIAYDPFTAGRVLLQGDGGYERVSLDNGDTWAQPPHTFAAPDNDVPWLVAANGFGVAFFFVTLGGLQFDPVVAGRVWMSEGVGVWYADLATSSSANVGWVAQSRGIEQLVTNDVLCPPAGPPVVVCWDRSVFLAGETTSVPVVAITTPQPVPVGTGGSVSATLVRGHPQPITYSWSVTSKPGGSGGGTLTAPTALQTAFTPDVAGSYTLRLTATNPTGTTTTDVALTATTKVTGLILPGSAGNYLSTPAHSSLDITGSLTMLAKLSMASWQPATETAIIGKMSSSSKSYSLSLKSTGLRVSLLTNPVGSAGLNTDLFVPLAFPAGSVQWVKLVYDATAQTITAYTSVDGTTWTLNKSQSTTTAIGATPLAVSTAPLCVGWYGGLATSSAANARIYKAQVYDGATLVADFDAEPVTRTGTRLPATVTGTTGKVWTPQGTGWDWS